MQGPAALTLLQWRTYCRPAHAARRHSDPWGLHSPVQQRMHSSPPLCWQLRQQQAPTCAERTASRPLLALCNRASRSSTSATRCCSARACRCSAAAAVCSGDLRSLLGDISLACSTAAGTCRGRGEAISAASQAACWAKGGGHGLGCIGCISTVLLSLPSHHGMSDHCSCSHAAWHTSHDMAHKSATPGRWRLAVQS